MSHTTKGFTLVEILIAVVLSSIILLGLYEMFASVFNYKGFGKNRHKKLVELEKVISLMQRDINCKVGSFGVQYDFGRRILYFKTTHSLRYSNSAVAVVRYYLRLSDHEFIREEVYPNGTRLKMPLTDMFSSFSFKFYQNGGFYDKVSPVIRITFRLKNSQKISFLSRGVVE